MKKNKKSIILGIGVIVLSVLAFLATNLIRNSDKSDSELLEFSIADTSTVDQIQIRDAYNNELILIRDQNGDWADSDGNCVIQEPVGTILETFKNVEFKGYVPENSMKNVTSRVAATNTEVKIYQNGKWVKTWYVGSATQDHYGTYMLLETPREKSDYPVIMKVRGLNGMIEPRFFADKRKWRCTEIFAVAREEIASVNVKFTEEKEKSFSVERNGLEYSVKHDGVLLDGIDTSMAVRYLNGYKKVHFELVNYDYTPKQIDSLKRSKPFCELTLKKVDGKVEKLRLFRMTAYNQGELDDNGDVITHDVDRFWCELPSGEVVKCQYFVFNPLIMGHLYFGRGKPVTTK